MEAVPSLQSALLRPHVDYCAQFWASCIQDRYKIHQRKNMESSQGIGVFFIQETESAMIVWPGEETSPVREDLYVYKYLIRGCKESELDSSQWYPVKGWGNGHKLKYWKLFEQKAFTLRVMKHWNRLLRGCKVSILGDIQNQTGYGPYQPFLCAGAWLNSLQRSLPPSLTILWFYKVSTQPHIIHFKELRPTYLPFSGFSPGHIWMIKGNHQIYHLQGKHISGFPLYYIWY